VPSLVILISINLQVTARAIGQHGERCIRCPRTGMNVQTWLDENDPPLPDQIYEPISCPACTTLHFINAATGKLLGSKDE
jgi:hypothetical protein